MASILNATTSSGLVTSADNSGSLQLATNNGTTAVTIDTSQNVGIGTASPSTYSAKLAVVASSGAANQWLVGGSSAGAYAYFSNNAQSSSANTMQIGQGWASGSDNIGFLNTNGANPILFATNGAERMRIDSSGRLLVGTTTNYGRTTLLGNNTDIPLACWNNAGTSGFFTMISFRNNAGTSEIGNVLRTNDNTISFNNTSDYRLKENIQPMVGALDKVARLKPCTYTWKSDGSAGQGFIAHELQEVVPDAVAGEKDAVNEDGSIRPQGIDTSFLVATLTAAIQELKAQLDESNLILTSVKTELDATKAEVQALKGTL